MFSLHWVLLLLLDNILGIINWNLFQIWSWKNWASGNKLGWEIWLNWHLIEWINWITNLLVVYIWIIDWPCWPWVEWLIDIALRFLRIKTQSILIIIWSLRLDILRHLIMLFLYFLNCVLLVLLIWHFIWLYKFIVYSLIWCFSLL